MSSRTRIAALSVLAASACNQDTHHSRAGWEDVSDVTLPCNIAKARCRSAIFQTVAKLRDQPDAVLPDVRLITRDAYVAELDTNLGSGTEDLRSTRFSNAMGMLNLIARDQSLEQADSAASATSVLAYYDHRDDAITVISDNAKDDRDGSFTLAHELTHALQDQRENLTTLDRTYGTSWDAMIAVDALVEGEAMWMSLRFDAATSDRDPERDTTDAYFADWIKYTLMDIHDSASPLVIAQQLLPYGFGGKRVSTQWYDAGGDDAVAALYDHPGVTFSRWVEGAAVTTPAEMTCQPPETGPGGRDIEVLDYFGIPGVVALYTGLGHTGDEALELAKQWTNDWLAIYKPADPSSRDAAVAWRIQLTTAEQALALADEAAQVLGARTDVVGDEVALIIGTTQALTDELADAVPCASTSRRVATAQSFLVEHRAKLGRHHHVGRARLRRPSR